MSLKSRIEALTTRISNAKTSLRSALSNKGVSVPISPTWDQITQGINDIEIPSGDKYKELIGKGSIFSTKLDTNETARKMVMAPNKSTVSLEVNCNLDSIKSALDEINGCFYKGDLVVIVTYAMLPIVGNYGLCIYNLSEDLFSYFFSTDMKNGYPWVENALFLESVSITEVNTGSYNFSFTGYALKVGKSPVD